MSAESRDRLMDLLADRAVEGLSAAEQEELDQLLPQHPDVNEFDFDLTAAQIDAALAEASDLPLPEHLQTSILEQARFVVRGNSQPTPAPATPQTTPSRGALVGWLVAAGLAGVLLFRAVDPSTAPLPLPTPIPTPAEVHAELAAAPQSIELEWTATGDAAGPEASGEVIWNNAAQRGSMRFRGLAANDPDVYQYQLWIFDADRDERFPIDGGVFDIDPETGDAWVTIDPKLTVDQPALFAVTIERPGGVVVSDRERIAVLAKVET